MSAAGPEPRREPRPACPACGAAGRARYRGLVDAVWGAPGRWDLVRCARPGCGTLWADPAPDAAELAAAYARYQTHAPLPPPAPGPLRRLYERGKRAHLARAWGYGGGGRDVAGAALAALLALIPQQRARIAAGVHQLRGEWRGRLLDVGCGAGDGLARLAALGWRGEGVEPDPAAAAAARARGLAVATGTLEAQRHPDGAFAAVTLVHVLEHVPAPGATLAACARLLAPGGRLVIETPNAGAWLHGVFGRDWRGLEPPRHLQVFTLASLTALVRAAGLEVERAFASPKSAAFFFAASWAAGRARRAGRASADRWGPGLMAAAQLAALAEAALAVVVRGAGEELVVVARRPAGAA